LDMMGPSTLDGGYSSPSQDISSAIANGAMVKVGCALRLGVKVTEVLGRWLVVETGANAEDRVTTIARRSMQSLAIVYLC